MEELGKKKVIRDDEIRDSHMSQLFCDHTVSDYDLNPQIV